MKVFWVVRPAEGGIVMHLQHLLAGLEGECNITILGPETVKDLAGSANWLPFHIEDKVRPSQDIKAVWQLSRILRKERPDLVHLHGLKTALVGVPACKLAGFRKVIFTAHNSLPKPTSTLIKRGGGIVQRKLLSAIPTIISVSDSLRDELLDYVPEHRVRTIHNGIDLANFSGHSRAEARAEQGAHPGELLIGTVTRLIPAKGVATLIEAASLISNVIPKVRFVVAGDGPDRNRIVAYRDKLQLEDKVKFLGWREDVPYLMSGWDLFVLPSYSEGFNTSLLEAMAARLPLIATDLPSIREAIIPGKSGLVVQPKDAPALAAAILNLAKDMPKARAMGEFNQGRVQRLFGVEQMVECTKALYHELARQEYELV